MAQSDTVLVPAPSPDATPPTTDGAAEIPPAFRDLADCPPVAALTTVMPDGSPQTSAVWCDTEGSFVRINTMLGFRKEKNMRANPLVTLLCFDPAKTLRYLEIRGTVVEMTETGAIEHLDGLSMRYAGAAPYFGRCIPESFRETETPVLCRILPTRVLARDWRADGDAPCALTPAPQAPSIPPNQPTPPAALTSPAVPIPESHLDLVTRPVHGVLTTMMPDGQPQSSLVWVDFDGECAVVNTTLERRKGRNIAANPKVSLLVVDPSNTGRFIQVRGWPSWYSTALSTSWTNSRANTLPTRDITASFTPPSNGLGKHELFAASTPRGSRSTPSMREGTVSDRAQTGLPRPPILARPAAGRGLALDHDASAHDPRAGRAGHNRDSQCDPSIAALHRRATLVHGADGHVVRPRRRRGPERAGLSPGTEPGRRLRRRRRHRARRARPRRRASPDSPSRSRRQSQDAGRGGQREFAPRRLRPIRMPGRAGSSTSGCSCPLESGVSRSPRFSQVRTGGSATRAPRPSRPWECSAAVWLGNAVHRPFDRPDPGRSRQEAGLGPDGRVESREYLSLTVSVDHDVVNGAPVARFISRFRESVESASLLRVGVGPTP